MPKVLSNGQKGQFCRSNVMATADTTCTENNMRLNGASGKTQEGGVRLNQLRQFI